MIDYKAKLNDRSNVSAETFQKFDEFLKENLFNGFGEFEEYLEGKIELELVSAWTTLTYLNVRYLIQVPDSKNLLSIIVSGTKNFKDDGIYTDHLKSDFSIVNKELTKIVEGVRYFEGEFESFKKTFYEAVLPFYLNKE